MARFANKPPSITRHKATGQAVVRLSGKDFYLGPWGTKISRDTYDRIVAEWLAAGRTLPGSSGKGEPTINEIVLAYYKSDEATPSHLAAFKASLSLLVRFYGITPAIDFGPKALKSVRERMISKGWKRKTINSRIHILRRVFRWAVSNEMIPASVSQSLDTVEGLKAGRTKASESDKVQPVAVEHVESCIPFMPRMIQNMVRIQLLTGMRSCELLIMRSGDIETSGNIWVYRPGHHKSQHLGKVREIAIGPKAQAILSAYLLTDLEAYIFSPSASEQERRQAMHQHRKTPIQWGNRPGTNRKTKPAKVPGNRYQVPEYRRALYRAADRAYPLPVELARLKGEKQNQHRIRLGKEWVDVLAWRKKHRWNPHQLRHTFAQLVRDEFNNLDAVQRSLGHATANVSQIYAGVSLSKAVEVAAKLG